MSKHRLVNVKAEDGAHLKIIILKQERSLFFFKLSKAYFSCKMSDSWKAENMYLFTRDTHYSQAKEAASPISWKIGNVPKICNMHLITTWCYGAAAPTEIRNALLGAPRDSSKQFFLPFRTYIWEFFFIRSARRITAYRRVSQSGFNDLFLWPRYQWSE